MDNLPHSVALEISRRMNFLCRHNPVCVSEESGLPLVLQVGDARFRPLQLCRGGAVIARAVRTGPTHAAALALDTVHQDIITDFTCKCQHSLCQCEQVWELSLQAASHGMHAKLVHSRTRVRLTKLHLFGFRSADCCDWGFAKVDLVLRGHRKDHLTPLQRLGRPPNSAPFCSKLYYKMRVMNTHLLRRHVVLRVSVESAAFRNACNVQKQLSCRNL